MVLVVGDTEAVAVAFCVTAPIAGVMLKDVTFWEKYVRVVLPPRMMDDGETASLHRGSW